MSGLCTSGSGLQFGNQNAQILGASKNQFYYLANQIRCPYLQVADCRIVRNSERNGVAPDDFLRSIRIDNTNALLTNRMALNVIKRRDTTFNWNGDHLRRRWSSGGGCCCRANNRLHQTWNDIFQHFQQMSLRY